MMKPITKKRVYYAAYYKYGPRNIDLYGAFQDGVAWLAKNLSKAESTEEIINTITCLKKI